MRKISAILGTMLLTFFLANSAIAQSNQNAYFMVDTDIATSGYQGLSPVTGIGPTTQVGFALYAQGWDSSKGFTVRLEWDATKAEFRPNAGSGPEIIDNTITINGASITPPPETCILGVSAGDLLSPGATTSTGVYENSWAAKGATASTAATGLIYFAIFRSLSTFNSADKFQIAASVTVADANAVTRFLGTRYFYVNQEIDVKTSSWGEVKKQFKDF